MLRRRIARALIAGAGAIALLSTGTTAQAAPVSVTNKTQFTDTDGAVIHAHGGGVIKVGSYYYWFGENRKADNTFKAVSMYRSTDLKAWEFQRDVLTSASHPDLAVAKIERPKVIYNSTTGKYVMWMHKEQGLPANHYTDAEAAVAVSDTIDGEYTWQGSFRAPNDATSRDQTLFKDDDGTAYQITSSDQNADLHIYKLNASYTGYDKLVANPWDDKFREAPALFKRDGVYFMLTSGNSGWSPNQQRYATATSLAGPWTPMADIGDSQGYGSQTAFVLPVQGASGTSYLYMGDRWGNSFGGTVNDSQYVWLPLKFPTRTTMVMPYYPQITVDTAAGTVSGSGGGPYHTLVARHSEKCVDISDNSAANKAAVLQYTCNGGLNQQWRTVDKGNGYVNLKAQHSGKCLDVSGASLDDRGVVQQYDCTGSVNQEWKFQDQGDGYYRLVARHSGKCLDVSGVSTANGARIFQYTCGSGTNQQFKRPAG